MYIPIDQNRHWDRDRLYSQITWTNFNEVIDAFEKRINDWYLNAARSLARDGHLAFSVMALDCLLIDMLSQYHAGDTSSSKATFVGYCTNVLGINRAITPSIRYIYDGQNRQLRTEAEALYTGFRCGIVHEAHVPLYGGIDPGQSDIIRVSFPSDAVRYADGSDCPAVVANPLKLLLLIEGKFVEYLRDLKNPSNTTLINNFKTKFTHSFGKTL